MKTIFKAGLFGMATLAGGKAITSFDFDLPQIDVSSLSSMAIAMADEAETDHGGAEDKDTQKEQIKAPSPPPEICVIPEILVDIEQEKLAFGTRVLDLDVREAELHLAEKAISEQARQLDQLRGDIEALLASADAKHVNDVSQLVRIYTSMKAPQAATILDDADIAVSVQVIAAMKEADSGPILAEMNPVRARAISKILFERSRLPGDQDLVGIQLN